MDDVVDQVLLAAGDPDLGAADRIAAVRLRRGAGADQPQVSTALRLGQAHGAGPLTADQLGQVLFLLLAGAVLGQRIDRTMGQPRVHTQRQVGRADHLLDHHVQHMRQALAAELRGTGQRGPATFGELLVGGLETVRGLHGLAHRVIVTTLLVTGTVDRRQDVFRQLGGFFQNGATEIVSELALRGQRLQGGIGVEQFVEDKLHITKRGAISGHAAFLKAVQEKYLYSFCIAICGFRQEFFVQAVQVMPCAAWLRTAAIRQSWLTAARHISADQGKRRVCQVSS